ncbi:hypothetical protein BpHYR1_036902 [Brachionus plicatilis]|uniref:Uncharacterized protein n=1 Tax=Brachionus plicatilis TaxID=10195 RepID=A0A3M7R7A6_BRAPC|nr:hypothetical protein BpHYR1_036902 [Brachionus plicatilis]
MLEKKLLKLIMQGLFIETPTLTIGANKSSNSDNGKFIKDACDFRFNIKNHTTHRFIFCPSRFSIATNLNEDLF